MQRRNANKVNSKNPRGQRQQQHAGCTDSFRSSVVKYVLGTQLGGAVNLPPSTMGQVERISIVTVCRIQGVDFKYLAQLGK
eukprot:2384733-Amphidinium_carterae.1